MKKAINVSIFKIIIFILIITSTILFIFINDGFLTTCSTINLLNPANNSGDNSSIFSIMLEFLSRFFDNTGIVICFIAFIVLVALSVILKIIYNKKTMGYEKTDDKVTTVLKILDTVVFIYLVDSIVFNIGEFEPFSFWFFNLIKLIVFSVVFVAITVLIILRKI